MEEKQDITQSEYERRTLAIYLQALAALQANGKTYVNREVTAVKEKLDRIYDLD